MHRFTFIEDNSLTKVQQIAEAIKRDIEKGVFKRNEQLLSINNFSDQYNVARDTIEKAYKLLRRQDYVISLAGKGYFVAARKDNKIRVLLIFNKLSTYKKIIYDSFIRTLGKKVKVDLQIHHYDPRLLREIIESNLDKYHYYVIMPHFFLDADEKECRKILEMIPANELVILDKKMKGMNRDCIEVYQDFSQDIYNALLSAKDLLSKYNRIEMLLDPASNHPREIIEGATQFCVENKKKISISIKADQVTLKEHTVYIVTTESDLAILVKKTRISGKRLGRDIGIISFNETVLKELLDITVITTDFEAMGAMAAKCIIGKKVRQISNPFCMIRRKSL